MMLEMHGALPMRGLSDAYVAIVRSPSAKSLEKVLRRGVDHLMAEQARAMTDGLCKMTFADTGLADKTNIFVLVDEGTCT